MESVGGGSVRALQPEPQLQAWTGWVPCRDDVCCTPPSLTVSHPSPTTTTANTSAIRVLSARSLPSVSLPSCLSPLTDGNSQLPSYLVPRSLRYQYASHPSIHPTSLIEQPYTRPAKPPSTWGRSCSVSHPTFFPAQAGNHTGGEQDHPANPIPAIASPQCPPTLVSIPLALSSHPQSSLLPYSLSASLPEQIFSVPPLVPPYLFLHHQHSFLSPTLILS